MPSELAHADILNRAGQVVILDHASHVQVFQRDDIGALDDGRGGLVAAGAGAAARSVRPADLLTRECGSLKDASTSDISARLQKKRFRYIVYTMLRFDIDIPGGM